MLDNNGEIGAPCGVPIPWSLFRVVRWRFPFASVSSTGVSSHILISRSTRPSLIRRDTDFINSAWGILSKYPDKSASTTSVCLFLTSRSTWRTASRALRAVGVLFGLQVGLED